MTDSGRCRVCHRMMMVRKDGLVRYHGPHQNPCPGSFQPPEDSDA